MSVVRAAKLAADQVSILLPWGTLMGQLHEALPHVHTPLDWSTDTQALPCQANLEIEITLHCCFQ